MVKTGQIKHCLELDKLARHLVAMCNPQIFLIHGVLKNNILAWERDFVMSKNMII